MKIILIGILLSILSIPSAFSDSYVRGYAKNIGTYLAPHYRSKSNNAKSDNWSQIGNTNPYTGKSGTSNCG